MKSTPGSRKRRDVSYAAGASILLFTIASFVILLARVDFSGSAATDPERPSTTIAVGTPFAGHSDEPLLDGHEPEPEEEDDRSNFRLCLLQSDEILESVHRRVAPPVIEDPRELSRALILPSPPRGPPVVELRA